jgi:hypothetical protein
VITPSQIDDGRQAGSYPETGLEEINCDLLEADFWVVSEISFA